MDDDCSLQEAVKLIWFQYLKHYGYAFSEVEDDDSKAEITSTSRGRKRGVGNTPRAKRAKMELNLFDAFPEDDHLFHSDSDSDSDLEWEDGIKQSGLSLQSGEELYLQRRSDKLCKRIAPVYFTLKHTIALCYLALLYTKQNVMLSDLSRLVQLHTQLPFLCRYFRVCSTCENVATIFTGSHLVCGNISKTPLSLSDQMYVKEQWLQYVIV